MLVAVIATSRRAPICPSLKEAVCPPIQGALLQHARSPRTPAVACPATGLHPTLPAVCPLPGRFTVRCETTLLS